MNPETQAIIDHLLTAFINSKDDVNLIKILEDGYRPSVNLDIITLAANLSEGRKIMLRAIFRFDDIE